MSRILDDPDSRINLISQPQFDVVEGNGVVTPYVSV
jgi:hypothetical protein